MDDARRSCCWWTLDGFGGRRHCWWTPGVVVECQWTPARSRLSVLLLDALRSERGYLLGVVLRSVWSL